MRCSLPAFLLAFVVCARGFAADAPVAFNRDIRPILSENCFYCHGFDPKNRKADLRLDTREGALAEHDGLRAIVPGKPAESELLTRIFSDDTDEVMPPPKAHKTLTPEQKELLRRWIAQGAEYQPHWAFVAPVQAPVPPGQEAVDFFLAQRLKSAGLPFSAEEERGPLLRRVTLDLTGLPPTRAELEAFEYDAAPDAYARAVERLLASPRFGEQMAMPWLDAARYADTNGYQMDAYRMNWPWRDWVVNAFNTNLPFDRFTIEQLAGDLLPNPTEAQMVATAFNRNHMLNAEGGTIPEENRTKNVFDRVETTSTVFLGLTMGCSQCHDHKFDPITQRDYYSMYALFNQLSEPGGVNKRFGRKPYSWSYDNLYMVESPYLVMASEEQKAQLAANTKARNDAEAAFKGAQAAFYPPFEAWVLEMRATPALIPQRLSEELDQRAVSSAKLENLGDGNTRRLLTQFFKKARAGELPQPEGVERGAQLFDAVLTAREVDETYQGTVTHLMVMRDDKPRETRILQRGNYEMPGDVVPPNTPAALPPLPAGTKADRLALAKWLVAPENPLFTRVTVNRFWQQFFGRGLVKTPDDFGLQGALPSHPELLDWLAVEFRQSGWDVKELVRRLVLSRAYRQRNATTPELLAKDPENVLLARGPRFRLDSRVLRDQALALSGLLVEQMGGAPVRPYQPPGIWEEMSFGMNRYEQDHGAALYRRSLYTVWRRVVAPASFFDVPARQVCSVKPQRTSTPLHALTTLNDPTYVEVARVWAERLQALPSDEARFQEVIYAATARRADAAQLASLGKTLAKARALYVAHPEEAAALCLTGEAPRRSTLAPAEHAAWATVCLLALNLDETLCR